MEVLVADNLGPVTGNRMLDHIIHNGKKLYILDRLLPETPDTVIMEYTKDQLNWVAENESNIWTYFTSEELFYEIDFNKFQKYTNPSPHSPGMPPEAPGRTGNWLGWQIVERYMAENPEADIGNLIENRDAQGILEQSRYKPRRR